METGNSAKGKEELPSLFVMIDELGEKINSIENTVNEACIASKKLMPYLYSFEEPSPNKASDSIEETNVINRLRFIYNKADALHKTVNELRHHLEQVTAF